MLQTRNLSHRYGSEKTLSFPDLEVADGQHLVILGQSGVGKTTLLHLIAGILSPDQGSVILNARDITNMNARELDAFRGQHIGIVFQKPYFIRSLSVLQNLLLIQHLAHARQDRKRAEQVLEEVGLGAYVHQNPQKLSEGEQQRLCIAMAVINKPGLILADEPTSSLDDLHCKKVLNLLMEEANRNQAHLLIITHDHRVKDSFENQLVL